MATKKKAEQATEPAGAEMLQNAAKAIGTAIGTIAVNAGIAHAEPRKSQKIPKLAKKDKKRLPRKEKKKLAKKQAQANSA